MNKWSLQVFAAQWSINEVDFEYLLEIDNTTNWFLSNSHFKLYVINSIQIKWKLLFIVNIDGFQGIQWFLFFVSSLILV